MHVLPLCVDQFVIADFRTRSGVAGAETGEMRRKQRIKAQLAVERFIEHLKLRVHQQDRQVRIRQHVFYDTIAAARFRIRQAIKNAIALGIFNQMIQVAFFLVTERFAVADEKLKIARVRFIDMRIINLVHDAVTEGEPDTATGVIRRAHAFFRARSPARFDSRRAKRQRILRRTHPQALGESNPNSKMVNTKAIAIGIINDQRVSISRRRRLRIGRIFQYHERDNRKLNACSVRCPQRIMVPKTCVIR